MMSPGPRIKSPPRGKSIAVPAGVAACAGVACGVPGALVCGLCTAVLPFCAATRLIWAKLVGVIASTSIASTAIHPAAAIHLLASILDFMVILLSGGTPLGGLPLAVVSVSVPVVFRFQIHAVKHHSQNRRAEFL